MRTLVVGAFLQGLGIAANALLITSGTNLTMFMLVMGLDDFALGFAGVTLVAYMSSLTSLGYVATQYGILSATYAATGKFFKGFSGLIVETLTPAAGLMGAYALLFIGCGLLGIPSLLLFWLLEQRRKAAITPG